MAENFGSVDLYPENLKSYSDTKILFERVNVSHRQRFEEERQRDWFIKLAKEACLDQKDSLKHVNWAMKHWGAHLLTPEELSDLQENYTLRGSASEIQEIIKAQSAEAITKKGQWQHFAQTILAHTLRHMEERGDSAEKEMDVLVSALRPVRPFLRPGLSELMLAARLRLVDDKTESTGYYKTRGALADQLSALTTKLARQTRSYLYWEILQELSMLPEEILSNGDWASIVNTDANNLAVAQSDLYGHKAAVRWMRLSVIAGSAARNRGADDAAEKQIIPALNQFFAREDVTEEWGALLGDMCNVPNTWQYAWEGSCDKDMWLVELGAAIGRCGFGDADERPRKVANALFNAGVSVSRGAKTKVGDWKNPALARAVLYGAGLVWVFSSLSRLPEEDEVQVFQRARGGSCLVNFVGALADFSSAFSDDDLRALNLLLIRLQSVLDSDQALRIKVGLNKLSGKASHKEGNEGVVSVSVLISNLLFSEFSELSEWRQLFEMYVNTPSVLTLAALLEITGKSVSDNYIEARNRLADNLKIFEKGGVDWPQAFIDFDIDASTLREDETIRSELKRMEEESLPFPDRLVSMAHQLVRS